MKWGKNPVAKLVEYRVPHKYLAGDTVLLQYRVESRNYANQPANIGYYVETPPGWTFAAFPNFPYELVAEIQRQCDEQKKVIDEAARKTVPEKTA